MKQQLISRHTKPSYARSVRRTISLPRYLDEDARTKMTQTKVFDLSRYVQILIKRDTERQPS